MFSILFVQKSQQSISGYDNLPDCHIPFATLIAFARSVSRPVNGMITLEFYNILWQL